MSEESKAVAGRMMDLLSRHDQAGATALCAPDGIFHGFAETALNREVFSSSLAELFRAYPDINFRVDDMFSEDNKVAVRYYMEGTHQGEFMGLPGNGKAVSVYSGATLLLENGLVKEFWNHADNLGWLMQLGMVQLPGQPAVA